MNFTHRIDEFSFGRYYPGLVNPLDDTFKVTEGRKYYPWISPYPFVYCWAKHFFAFQNC